MSEKYIAYVGSYTHESSKGIHLYDMDVEKGRITERTEFPIDNPSYITLSHSGNFLYSICDQGVTSFSIEPDGSLNKLNVVSINGMRGCHITLSKDDRFLIVSGYHDGKLTVLSLEPDGRIGKITDEVFHKGMGSIADRNFRPHISWSVFTPDEELYVHATLVLTRLNFTNLITTLENSNYMILYVHSLNQLQDR